VKVVKSRWAPAGLALATLALAMLSTECQRHLQTEGNVDLTKPTISITVTGGRAPDQGVLVAWPDGVLVWSDDLRCGGPPYHIAQLEPAAMVRSVDDMTREGRWVGERQLGPDGRWTHIVVRVGTDTVIDVGSWHEVHEANPQLVVTATGIEALAGRQRDDLLAQQPDEHRSFRRRWELVKERALALVPSSGRPLGPGDQARMPWSQIEGD
jgi:hypothetical protein